MAEQYEAYLKFLGELTRVLDRLTQIAREKAAAVRQDDLVKLNECMKQEQVQSLALRGMDQKRERLLAALGLSGTRLNQLAEHYPEELRLHAKQTVERLQDSYKIYRSANSAAQHTLECNLHEVEKMIEEEAQKGIVPPHNGGMTDFLA